MHFVLSSYDQMDIFQFGLGDYDDNNKPTVLIVTIGHPYDMHQFVPKMMGMTSRAAS